jgi:MFS family permease
MVAAVHVGKVPPVVPSLREQLGATLGQAGWLLSTINLVTALSGMAIALTAERIGHRRLVILGTALSSLASFLGGFLDSVDALLVERAFEGIGFIAVAVAVPSALMALAQPGDQRRAMVLWSMYMPAGAGSMMLASALFLPGASWRAAWFVAAAASACMLAALLLAWKPAGPRRAPSAARRPVLHEMAEVATSAGPLAIALCFAAYSSCWFAVLGFLPTLQMDRLGLSLPTAAVVTALVTVVNVGGNLTGGWLLQRGVRRVVLVVASAIAMAFCAAGLFLEVLPDALRLVLAGVYSAGIGVIPPSLFTALPVHAPRPQLLGASTGLLMQGSSVGALLGPPITGALVAAGGWSAAVWLTSGALAIAAAAGAFLHQRERRKLLP